VLFVFVCCSTEQKSIGSQTMNRLVCEPRTFLAIYRIHLTPSQLLSQIIDNEQVIVYWILKYKNIDFNQEMLGRLYHHYRNNSFVLNVLDDDSSRIVSSSSPPSSPPLLLLDPSMDIWSNEIEMARQFILVDYELFYNTNFILELLTTRTTTTTICNIQKILDRSKNIKSWIQTLVITPEEQSDRIYRMSKFIDMATFQYEHNNWQGFMNIMNALTSDPIQQLKQTRAKLSRYHSNLLEQYISVTIAAATTTISIPYIQPFINKIMFLKESSSSLDWDQLADMYNTYILPMEQVQQKYQYNNNNKYPYLFIPKLQSAIEYSMLNNCERQEGRLYLMAKRKENS
jgi:hypothetical protein